MASVTGLEGVVVAETELSLVDGEKGILIYRGYAAKDLALHTSFEEAAYLMWSGRLPTKAELFDFRAEWKRKRDLPTALTAILDLLPVECDMMSVLRTAISIVGAMDGTIQSWPPDQKSALRYTAMLPTLIAYRFRRKSGLEPIEPHPDLDHAANYLYMLTGKVPQPAHVKVLTAYFVLTMEHGMNASTFAARATLSTQSDMASALCTAIGVMKGPLHGGAPSEVAGMLDEIGSKEQAESWLRKQLDAGQKLMGFGHRIYKTFDPRAEALRIITTELSGEDAWFELAVHVETQAIALLEAYKPGRRLYTNVEFYAAAVLKAIAMPKELFTPSFTASRMVGWTAHLLEQAGCNRIFRPQSVYVGTPLEETEANNV